jgi:hypothetical protein
MVCNKSANKWVVIQQKWQQNGALPTKVPTNIEWDLTDALIKWWLLNKSFNKGKKLKQILKQI